LIFFQIEVYSWIRMKMVLC